MPPIRIVVDDRETNRTLVETLINIGGTDVSIRRLELGDYELDGRLLFERKTLPDLAASIKDGRLFQQACRLAASPLCKALILEGTSQNIPANGMRREAMQGALIHLTLFLGIPLLRSTGPEESARLMVYTARQFESIARAASPRLFKGKRPKGKHKTQLQILQALPGIGAESARHLLESFGSVEAVFRASEEDLRAAPGVGSARARSIRWAVGENAAAYAWQGDPVLWTEHVQVLRHAG